MVYPQQKPENSKTSPLFGGAPIFHWFHEWQHIATLHQYIPRRGSVGTFAEFYTKLIGLRGRFSAASRVRFRRPGQIKRIQHPGNSGWKLSIILLYLILKFLRNMCTYVNYIYKCPSQLLSAPSRQHSPKLGPRRIPHRLFELLNRRLQQLTKVRQCTLAAANAPKSSGIWKIFVWEGKIAMFERYTSSTGMWYIDHFSSLRWITCAVHLASEVQRKQIV